MRFEDSSNWGYTGKKLKHKPPKGSGGGCLVVLLAMSVGTWATFLAERLVF